MSNQHPRKDDPDPYAQRAVYHITARIFSSPNNEVGRLNYVRTGADAVGTLVAHILYANSSFYAVELFVTNRPPSDKTEPRTDPLKAL